MELASFGIEKSMMRSVLEKRLSPETSGKGAKKEEPREQPKTLQL
jgi:hypothetical protein